MTLENRAWAVTLDPAFPRALAYQARTGGGRLAGQPDPFVPAVELNGKPEPFRVAFARRGAQGAEYRLTFPNAGIELTLRVTVTDRAVEWRLADVRERGAVKLMRFAFPGCALLTVSGAEANAGMAAVRTTGYNQGKEILGPLADLDATGQPETGNYLFLSANGIAAGILNTHIDDAARVRWTITETAGVKRVAAQNPVWQYRELETQPLPPQAVAVALTGDRNGDGAADWQDAALAYRDLMGRPYGAEFVRTSVADQIAMNFASLTQQPFLRILDEVKKAYLLTDGLGQSVLIKGYTAEGHDSANTDYGGHPNERAGGLKDLQFLMARAKSYGARIGVHVNATEVYPEAHRYRKEILDLDGQGRPKGGWYWLDYSHLIDKRKDLLTGQLFAALDLMRKELPDLDFIYVDVYGDRGWNAWQLASKLRALRLPIYTEYATVFDPWSVWAHNRSFQSRIVRFLWNGDRDLASPDPLLRGADHVGFMGWQGERDFHAFARQVFARNLPTKYLQHFPLLRWEPGHEAVFGNGVRVEQQGDAVSVTRDGQLRMTWTGNGNAGRLFIPWDPIRESRIYVWSDDDAERTWDLPPSWAGKSEVYLYRLTDLGRTDERKVAVRDGRVTLKVPAATPHVLYPDPAPAPRAMDWGEGSPVKEPGFDSHGFTVWTRAPAGAAHVRSENTAQGNTRLLISGGEGAAGGVSQVIRGLKPGGTYAASVWVQVTGERLATLSIQLKGVNAPPAVNSVRHSRVRNRLDSESKLGTNFQRMRVVFTLPPACSEITLTLSAGPGAPDSAVEFDDVRLVPTRIAPEARRHTFWEDFENVDQGWGPFVYDCGGQTQTHLSETNPGITDDTIRGRYSFKTRDEPEGQVVRTLPCTLRLKPNTRYRLAVETLADQNGIYRLQVKNGDPAGDAVLLDAPVEAGRHTAGGTFATGAGEDSYLAVVKDAKGGGKLVLDDLAVDELGPAAPTGR